MVRYLTLLFIRFPSKRRLLSVRVAPNVHTHSRARSHTGYTFRSFPFPPPPPFRFRVIRFLRRRGTHKTPNLGFSLVPPVGDNACIYIYVYVYDNNEYNSSSNRLTFSSVALSLSRSLARRSPPRAVCVFIGSPPPPHHNDRAAVRPCRQNNSRFPANRPFWCIYIHTYTECMPRGDREVGVGERQ